MKTNQAIIGSMVAALAVAITGCSNSGQNPQENASQATPASSSQAASAAPLKSIDAQVVEKARSVGACALDQANGSQLAESTNLPKGGNATFTGWSSDEKLHAPAQVTLIFQGPQLYGATIPTGQPRPDVAKSLGGDSLANSGFSAPVDMSTVAPGDYAVKVLVQESDDSQLCDTKKHLVISN